MVARRGWPRYAAVMRLSRAMIYVKDVRRMTAFYSELLGLTQIEETRSDVWAEFDTGSTRLALHAIPAPIAENIEISDPPRPREDNPVKLNFEVEDVEAECARLKALGVTVVHHAWGGHDGTDPEGNVFGIWASAEV